MARIMTVIGLLAAAALAAETAAPAAGTDAVAIPQLINYQGKLTDASGNPLSGTYNFTFNIYDGATQVWTETQTGVQVTDGIFNVLLGAVAAITGLPEAGNCSLEVVVESEAIAPKVPLVAAPYAYHSDNTGRLQGTPVSGTAPTADQVLVYTGGAWTPTTVSAVGGSGTANYVARWTAATTLGNSAIRDDGTQIAVGAAPNATYYIYGYRSGGVGVVGENSAGGTGVGGGSSSNWGGFFATSTGTGALVAGRGSLGGGVSAPYGMLGCASYGVFGYATGSYNYGVYGYASGSYSYGVYGYSGSSYGVYGYGYYRGVYGYSSYSSGSPLYAGVYGYNTSGCGVTGYGYYYGVYGYSYYSSSTPSYAAVYGYNYNGVGVTGYGYYYGVYGYTSGSSGPYYGVAGYWSSSMWGALGNYYYGVYGFNSSFYGVYGYGSGSYGALAGYNTSGYYARVAFSSYKIYGSGLVSTFIIDENDMERTLHCPEAPGVVFEDYGSARLVNGQARVEIDPLLLRGITINAEHPLRVYVTPKGREPVAMAVENGNTYFDVFGPAGSNVAFDWRLVATRKGYEDMRFEAHERPADRRGKPEPTPANPWPEQATVEEQKPEWKQQREPQPEPTAPQPDRNEQRLYPAGTH